MCSKWARASWGDSGYTALLGKDLCTWMCVWEREIICQNIFPQNSTFSTICQWNGLSPFQMQTDWTNCFSHCLFQPIFPPSTWEYQGGGERGSLQLTYWSYTVLHLMTFGVNVCTYTYDYACIQMYTCILCIYICIYLMLCYLYKDVYGSAKVLTD